MAAEVKPTTQKQGWLSHLASTSYKYTLGPVVATARFGGRVAYGTYRAGVIAKNLFMARGTLTLAQQQAMTQTGVEARAKAKIGWIGTTALKYAATKVVNAVTPDKVIYYQGRDLNPLHLQMKKPAAHVASAADEHTPVSAVAAKKKHHAASLQTKKPAARVAATKAAPISVSDITAPKQLHRSSKSKKVQHELRPANVKKYKDEAKLAASKTLYPIVTNYARAYWLFTCVLGIPLDKDGKNNQILMTFVDALRIQYGNNFSLKMFKQVVRENGITLTRWQSIKLFLNYYLLGSWISKLLLPALCNKGIDLLYDHLFGENGKKQEKLLINCTEKLAEFFEKYTELLEESKKRPSDQDQEEFLADLIKSENITTLCSEFANTLIDNFLPSIGTSLIRPQMKWIKQNIQCSEDSSVIVKGITFFVRILATIPIKILQAFGWMIETSIKKLLKSLIIDLGPTIVESTVSSLQTPMTQLNLEETLLLLLKDLKTSLEHPSPETEETLPFSAAKNSKISKHLSKLAERLGTILALKTPEMQVDADTILEQLIQTLNLLGTGTGERLVIDQVVSGALTSLVPEACINMLSQFLHPKEFTDLVVKKQIDIIANAFSPSIPFDEAAQAKKARIEGELRQVIREISTLSIQLAVKDVVENQLPQYIPETVEFPKVRALADKDRMIDLEDVVERSFVPRLQYKYIGAGIDCIFDENMERFGMIYIMKIVNSIFGREA